MKKTIYAIAALALVIIGCAKKEFNETYAPGDVVTVRAQVNDTYTKVAADNAGTFSWQANDKITILSSNGSAYDFTTSTGMSDAPFTCTTFEGSLTAEAFYPASSNHTSGKFYLEPSFAWKDGETNMPMIGIVNTETKAVSFKTAGAAIKLVCFNVPADARKLVVSSDSKKLSGLFDPEGTPAAIVTADKGASDNTITITFEAGHPTNMVFYVPVPTGNLGKLTFVMKDGSDADVSNVQETKGSISMSRAHIVAAPALNCSPYDVLLLETFDAPGTATESVSTYNSSKKGQTVYSGATINYSIGANTNTVVYQNDFKSGSDSQSNFAGGDNPGELLLAKKASSNNGEFIISGIPAKVSSALTLTFMCNKNTTTYIDVTSADTGITLSSMSASGASTPYTISYDITIDGGYSAETFSLMFSNGGSSNTRIDDILITSARDSYTAPSITPVKTLLTIDKDGGDDSTDFTYTNHADNTPIVAIVESGASWLTAAITGSGDNYTLTVSAEKNTDATRSAKVTLRATGVSKEITVNQPKSGGDPVVDVLNYALIGVSGTSYTAWSNKTSNSSAVYAGKSAGGNEAIQLRSSNSDSGIISTTSGGDVKKVVVVWNSNTANGRTIDIYGKTSAYTSPANLYGDAKGTKLGSIVKGTSTELTITGDYQYIGIRSNSGALYLDSISITWQ